MNVPLFVKPGIYIDMRSTAIQNVSEGVFIPTEYGTSEDNPTFQEDLAAFLDKWFSEGCAGAKDCPLATVHHL